MVGPLQHSTVLLYISGILIPGNNYSSSGEIAEGTAFFSNNAADIGGAVFVQDCTLTLSGR